MYKWESLQCVVGDGRTVTSGLLAASLAIVWVLPNVWLLGAVQTG